MKLKNIALAIGLMLGVTTAQASKIYIDNFTDYDFIKSYSNTTVSSYNELTPSGSDIPDISRTILVNSGTYSTKLTKGTSVEIDSSLLFISNDSGINGEVSIQYDMLPFDLTVGGVLQSLLLSINQIDLVTQVAITLTDSAGLTEFTGYQNFNDSGLFIKDYSTFTTVNLNEITGLKLDFKSSKQSWDGEFVFLASGNNYVNTSGTLSLVIIGLIGFSLEFNRKKV